MNPVIKLQMLYMQQSKHSNYQVLPLKLRQYLVNDSIKIKSRYEEKRLDFITSILDINRKKLLDIGGNTGFFTFELIDRGIKNAVLYEGNVTHAEFVRTSADILNVTEYLTVINSYLDTSNFNSSQRFDITLLMNVLHHIGDDYGDSSLSIQESRKLIIKSVQNMAFFTKYLVLQVGYCWKGNRNLPLFEKGEKQEQVAFLEQAISGYWNFVSIGIPEQKVGDIFYAKLSEKNMVRQNDLGEFLNRPLFILESKLLSNCEI